VTEGVWAGRVLTAPRGAGGFGYDVIFEPDGCELSAAQLPMAQKNATSHRAQALRALLAALT
jgi:XTP/dITP diphosphohydrolase